MPATKTYSVIYDFQGGADGSTPYLGSIGSDGAIYGATGGRVKATPHGTLFALTPSANGYSFATLAQIRSDNPTDAPTTGPVVTGGGALVGNTGTELYVFKNGSFGIVATFDAGAPPASSQPTLARGGSVYQMSAGGGIEPCVGPSGYVYQYGCGEIYRYDFLTDSK